LLAVLSALGFGSSRWKSYDWHQSHGMVFTNSRKMKKTAFLLDSSDKAEEWTAQYGSPTFSQHGKDFPLGGMNERARC
jgi:choloylglycine hydrolase